MNHHKNPLPNAIPSNRMPIDDGTSRYMVRDEDRKVFGENLTLADARKLKNEIAAKKISRTPGIEAMPAPVDADDLAVPPLEDAAAFEDAPAAVATSTDFEIGAVVVRIPVPSDGVIRSVPAHHRLIINDQERQAPTRVAKGDIISCLPLDAAAATARAAAATAAAAVMQQKRRVPLDNTVRKAPPRTTPAPPDRTVSRKPVLVRLGAPLEAPPQKFASVGGSAEMLDGDELSPDALTDDDIPDVASDLGGGPSDADVEHAKRQAEADAAAARRP